LTAFTTLRDGGLSVNIGGVLSGTTVTGGTERVAYVHGLEWETTSQGDGGASFWVSITNPFNPQAQFPEMVHGATVHIRHTLNSVTTLLYTGYIVSDTRVGYAGEKSILTVECGGVLEVIKGRGDMGNVFDDADSSQWFENKLNAKAYMVDTSDKVDIRVSDGDKVRNDLAGMVGYAVYEGSQYLLGTLPGIKWITGNISYDLGDNMIAGLYSRNTFTDSRNVSDYTHLTSATWGPNATSGGTGGSGKIPFSFAVGNHGYIVLAMWCNKTGGQTMTGERFVCLTDVVVHTATSQQRIDQAMLTVAQNVGLAPNGYSTPTAIDSVIPSLFVRPHVDPAAALSTLACMADEIVEWGYFKGQFIARPLEVNPYNQRRLTNSYLVSIPTPGIIWDVTQHPENGIPRTVRLLYGKTSATQWPAGSPAACVAPSDPGWGTGTPFMGASSPVLVVDFTQHNLTDAKAQTVATKLAKHLGMALSSGTVTVTTPTIPIQTLAGGGTIPAPYIRGADWIECSQASCGPLYIISSHVVVDTGYVTLQVGLPADALILQLAAAGAVNPVKVHPPLHHKHHPAHPHHHHHKKPHKPHKHKHPHANKPAKTKTRPAHQNPKKAPHRQSRRRG